MYRHSKDNWVPDFMKRRPDASMASGSTSIGVRQFLMKSRDTLYRKSGCTAYRLCRYFSIVSYPRQLVVMKNLSPRFCDGWNHQTSQHLE